MMPVGLRLTTTTIALGLAAAAAVAQSNMLLNPGFENGSSLPDSWNTWGDGSFIWESGDSHSGAYIKDNRLSIAVANGDGIGRDLAELLANYGNSGR